MAKVSLYELEYIIFDFETTGLNPDEGAEIIEIGAIKLRGTEPTGETFHSLINIQKKIPEQAKAINGISDKDLEGQPTIEEIFPKFIRFIGAKILIAHNAGFDLDFITENLKRFPQLSFTNFCIDTLQLSRSLFSYEKSHNLDAIAQRFGIIPEKSRHRSLGDCTITAKIFIEFLKILKRKNSATLHHIRASILHPPKLNYEMPMESLSLL